MLARAWIGATLALVACACACACASPRPAPTPAPSSTPTSEERASSEEPRVDPDPCAAVTTTEHLGIDEGAWRTSATGLSIRYEGASHDSFEGGGTDLSLALALWVEGEPSERWLPSALAPSHYTTFLGHCVRVTGGSAARAELDVAPLPRAPAVGPVSGACTDATIERLEDYALVADGRRYVVDVARDATHGAWEPTPLPRMPHHHASRLALRGLPDHPGLASLREPRARFVIEVLSRTVEQVPGRREWRAEYVARVVDVCPAPEAG